MAGSVQQIQFPKNQSVAFDVQAFNNAIMAQGLSFVHYRGMKSPLGLVDKYDARAPNEEVIKTENGLVYTRAGSLRGFCLSNTKEVRATTGGMLDSSTAQFTPLTHYLDTGRRIFLAPGDRLIMDERNALVNRSEVLECSPIGIDRPKFPVLEVLDCMDSMGNRYEQDTDFTVDDTGLIHWGERRPLQDVQSGKGGIYSIRYVYRPYWVVVRLMHELRMLQTQNPMTGEHGSTQGPQLALVQREFVFENSSAESDSRQSMESPAELAKIKGVVAPHPSNLLKSTMWADPIGLDCSELCR